MIARLRFHARWGWRLLAREPGRHALTFVALATVTLALTFVGALLWHASQPPVAAVGSAANELILADTAKQSLTEGLRALRAEGVRGVTVLEESVRFPGASSELPLRNQPLRGALGGQPYAVLEGRVPRGPGEMAVTPEALVALGELVGPGTDVGTSVKVGAGPALTIVGVVRDPRDHHAASMFVDDTVNLAPSSASFYTLAPLEQLTAAQADNPSMLALVPLSQGSGEGVVPLSILLAIGVLLAAGLLATATYAISARRRLREYGVLGSLGATSRQITTTITAVGIVTSTAAAVPGAALGYALTSVGSIWLEAFLGRDLAAGGPPLWVVVVPAVLMVCIATVAARRPARTIARIPVADALDGRMPVRTLSGRPARLAVPMMVLAIVAFAVGTATDIALVLFAAPLLTLTALLLLAPSLVRLVGRCSSRGPTAVRFALRDVARKPGSSVALLAGLTVVLTAPASIAVLTASAQHSHDAEPPNLPANVMLLEEAVGGLGGWSAVRPREAQANVLLRRLRARLPDARTSPIAVPLVAGTAVNTSEFGPRHPVYETVWAVQRRQRPPRVEADTPIWIATPELMHALLGRGLSAAPTADVLSDNPASVALREPGKAPADSRRPTPLRAPAADLLAGVWIAPDHARRHGWRPHVAGWIVVDDRPIPAAVRRAAAADAFPAFKVTGRDTTTSSAFPARLLLLGACLVALLLAGVVLALERLELERDVSIYAAIGARERVLRQMVGTRTAVLAAVASLCAIVVGYAVWLADRLFSADEPPFAVSVDLLLMAVGLPVMLGVACALAGSPRRA